MNRTFVWQRTALLFVVALIALLFAAPSRMDAQGGAGRGGAQAPAAPPTAQSLAPWDITGYWEAIITEDWRWRMVTPPKGDYQSVTLNAAARTVADTWDPDKDTAAGLQCKAYGAPAVMRVPGRLHITWKDPNTLQVDLEAGTQTRLLHFGPAVPAEAGTWQGQSAAAWYAAQTPNVGGGGGARPLGVPLVAPAAGGGGGGRGGRGAMPMRIKVLTNNIKPGYLRKNGVPYSADATMLEYWDLLAQADGGPWLVVSNFVDDPQYLAQTFATSAHFKKLADGSAWKPEPCTAK